MTAKSLFDPDAAWMRAELGMNRAADHAERVAPGWKGEALEAVRVYALTHETFMAEDVRAVSDTPFDADGRGWGAVMQQARQRRIVASDGYAPANSSNRSPKCRWRSLIFGGAK